MKRKLKLIFLSVYCLLGSKEGDILDIAITRNVQETEDAKERVSSLLEKLKNKNKEMKGKGGEKPALDWGKGQE